MADSTDAPASTDSNTAPRFNAGRIAWGVLLIAFAFFCGLCVITGIGVNYFLFQSTVPMQTIVRVGRGTVTWTDATLIPQATSSEIELFNSAIVSTDTVSQATLFVYDRYQGQLVAMLTLKNDTSLDIVQVARPRFDFSTQGYTIELNNASGEFDVHIPSNLGRGVTVLVHTPQDGIARLMRSGDYTLRVSDGQLQLVNNSGDASIAADSGANYAVPQGDRGIIQFTDRTFAVQPVLRINLLGMSGFDPTNVIEATGGVTPAEHAWGCNNQQNNPPSGFFALTSIDGVSTLQLGRGGGADSHGETFCSQYLAGNNGQQGLDVSSYSYLGIRATFKIVDQSLSTCGTDGSECPLMLRMEYVPHNGGAQTWIHGFFARIIAGLDYPLRCSSCTFDHEIVNPGSWYTYESGNLIRQFSADARPVGLLNFRFYASGHEYDVYVSDMQLIVGQDNPAPGGG